MMTFMIEIHGDTDAAITDMMRTTGLDMQGLLRRAMGLYQLAIQAVAEGKVVGVAATKDSPLETEFVGFGK